MSTKRKVSPRELAEVMAAILSIGTPKVANIDFVLYQSDRLADWRELSPSDRRAAMLTLIECLGRLVTLPEAELQRLAPLAIAAGEFPVEECPELAIVGDAEVPLRYTSPPCADRSKRPERRSWKDELIIYAVCAAGLAIVVGLTYFAICWRPR